MAGMSYGDVDCVSGQQCELAGWLRQRKKLYKRKTRPLICSLYLYVLASTRKSRLTALDLDVP